MEGKAVLASLLDQEQSLRGKAKILKSEMEGLNSEIVSKQSEIDCLLAKVAELKSNKRKCNFPLEENNGESHQGRKRIKLNNEWVIEPERLAETLLHEEMWREVFAKVGDGQDLLNASRACQHFHDILDPIKNNFLFGKIIPFLFLHLNLNDVLKCRLACRDWRSSINSFLEEWTKIYMLGFSSSNPFWLISLHITCAYSFAISKSKDANRFLQLFNSSARNPLVANSITLAPLSDDYIEYSKLLQYRKEVSTILETFGRHIHHSQCWMNSSPNVVAVDHLRELFSKAANLQTLVVSGFIKHVTKPQFEDIIDSLPNLKTLACKIDGEGKLPIENWLFRNFHLQITTLQLQNYDGLAATSEFTWPAVTELRIRYLDIDEGKDYLKCFESFPGLKKLCIFGSYSPLQNILCIIQHIPKVCPSFHALQLRLDRLAAERLCEKQIIVKELDTLELNVSHNDYGPPSRAFAFLLCFPFIKKLTIVLGSYQLRHLDLRWRKRCNMEIVELYKYFATNSNPRSSNIWRMLSNLETLQIKNKIYKRPKNVNECVENRKLI